MDSPQTASPMKHSFICHFSLQRMVGGHVSRTMALLVLAATNFTAQGQEGKIDFARDIRPILSGACFHCHGPDDATREADLRLDTFDGLFEDRGGYQVVKPGHAAESELARRLRTPDADERMPPPDSNKSLTARQQELLSRWIDEGAHWQQHWAFIPPAEPIVPEVEQADWCRSDLDRFILARMEHAGLRPAATAEPHTLVRRLYLDLIGLPPSPEEVDYWIARIWPSPNPHQDSAEHLRCAGTAATGTNATGSINEEAYQALVSYLLSSPNYGQRWARRWLDLARYADTNGYEKDRQRSIWPYRDWVIGALNEDMPFDQFTIEQLAGDMLPEATTEQRIATGFHRNTMLNEEGGIDPLEFRFHAMTDRVATTGTTWLGLTLGCCQCHTHKYDPISHTEYYQIMAFLNNADEPILELPDAQFKDRWQRNRQRAENLLAELASHWPLPEPEEAAEDENESPVRSTEDERFSAMDAAFKRWLSRERANAVEWTALRPVEATSNLPILTIQDDDSIFASGDTAKRDDYFIRFAPLDQPITAIGLEALPDERLPARGPGSTYYEGTLGDFYLTEIEATSGKTRYEFDSASETFAKNRFGKNPVSAALAYDGDVQTGWSVHGRQGERHVAVFTLAKPIPAGQPLSIHMTFGRHFASSLGRFRILATDSGKPQARLFSDRIAELLRKPEDSLSAADRQALLSDFLMAAPELEKQADKIRELRARPESPSTLVFAERPDNHRRPTHRHHRGEYLQPQEEVSPSVPQVLPPLPDGARQDRLGLARWIVSEENPLTARVIVNRHWATLFGTGLVKTVDDFGLQGQSPSHPELLDWLALRFVRDDGWSLKRLHRRIVSSQTYRQSSVASPRAREVDPDNRLLSYAPRFRLDAEVIRDSLLVASGALSSEFGGPPVHPPQPAGITEVTFGSPKWPESLGRDRYRRSIYTFIKRTAPFAMFSTFDAPSGEACIARRTRSNSPLQALTLLNDVMLVDLARAAGRRFASASDASDETLSAALQNLFRCVLVRPATDEELQLLVQFFHTQRGAFLEDSHSAQALLGLEDSQRPDGDRLGPGESQEADSKQLKSDDSQRASSQRDSPADDRALAGEEPDKVKASTGEGTQDESTETEPRLVATESFANQAAWTAVARALFGLDEAQTRN